jgi:phosphatidylglycerol:prolipoprotein diacylglycerol transferase
MSAPLQFPRFDPVLLHLGPLSIRWYALAYITGLVIGWQYMRRLVREPPVVANLVQTDDFLTWATLGVVLGGRLGYVLFYQPSYYLQHPLEIPAVWTGGMSFHGGMLGVVAALVLFCRRNRIPLLGFADRMAIVTPIGLGLGRIANFINGELWGRPAPDWLPWRMVFPRTEDGIARHPSQIYEALMEGLILFLIVWGLSRRQAIRARFGTLTGVFLIGYGIARMISELFREPDAFLKDAWFLPYLWPGASMGQLLSIPMILAGIGLIATARRSAGLTDLASPEPQPLG